MSSESFEPREKISPEIKYLEKNEQEIVTSNLEKMEGLLGMAESIGGSEIEENGKKYKSSAHNFYANPETGEIVVFGNSQHIEDEIKNKYPQFRFRIILSYNRKTQTGFEKIAEFIHTGTPLTEKVKDIFAVSIDSWNRTHAEKTLG